MSHDHIIRTPTSTPLPLTVHLTSLFFAVMPYNSAHHCVVEVENFLLLLGGEDQWNPNGKISNEDTDEKKFCLDTNKCVCKFLLFCLQANTALIL